MISIKKTQKSAYLCIHAIYIAKCCFLSAHLDIVRLEYTNLSLDPFGNLGDIRKGSSGLTTGPEVELKCHNIDWHNYKIVCTLIKSSTGWNLIKARQPKGK